MSDRDHERSAELCRQAALPVLRQCQETVIPKGTDDDRQGERERPVSGDSGQVGAHGASDVGRGLWLRLPH